MVTPDPAAIWSRRRWLRTVLLGGVVAGVWLTLTAVGASAAPVSPSSTPTPPAGLMGGVSSLLQPVLGLADHTVAFVPLVGSAVGPVTDQSLTAPILSTVGTVTAPVLSAVEPETAPVLKIIDQVTQPVLGIQLSGPSAPAITPPPPPVVVPTTGVPLVTEIPAGPVLTPVDPSSATGGASATGSKTNSPGSTPLNNGSLDTLNSASRLLPPPTPISDLPAFNRVQNSAVAVAQATEPGLLARPVPTGPFDPVLPEPALGPASSACTSSYLGGGPPPGAADVVNNLAGPALNIGAPTKPADWPTPEAENNNPGASPD